MVAYNVSVLIDFGNFLELKEIIFIGDEKPNFNDLELKGNDRILKIVERRDIKVIIKGRHEHNKNSRQGEGSPS